MTCFPPPTSASATSGSQPHGAGASAAASSKLWQPSFWPRVENKNLQAAFFFRRMGGGSVLFIVGCSVSSERQPALQEAAFPIAKTEAFTLSGSFFKKPMFHIFKDVCSEIKILLTLIRLFPEGILGE